MKSVLHRQGQRSLSRKTALPLLSSATSRKEFRIFGSQSSTTGDPVSVTLIRNKFQNNPTLSPTRSITTGPSFTPTRSITTGPSFTMRSKPGDHNSEGDGPEVKFGTGSTRDIIGIDLGTTNSCVALMEGSKVKVLENSEGMRTTPSCVAFSGEGEEGDNSIVGVAAKRQRTTKPYSTVFASKRLIGRNFLDPSVQRDRRSLPYEIVEGENGEALIEIKWGDVAMEETEVDENKARGKESETLITQERKAKHEAIKQQENLRPTAFDAAPDNLWVSRGQRRRTHSTLAAKTYSPSVVAGRILRKMRETAETYLQEPVKNAVITVPAYFNVAQRQATKDAGRIAGLNVTRILNEPTAAALAYGIDGSTDNKCFAVFDLGGGTFDVSILQVNMGVFEVKATSGDTTLGGEDLDILLCDHVLAKFKKTSGVDLKARGDKVGLLRIREAAEQAKIQLSTRSDAEVNLPFIHQGDGGEALGALHLSVKLTRQELEGIATPLLHRTRAPCGACLRDAQLDKDDLDEVILVGGMTRMPLVAEIVEKTFGKKPSRGMNPDEAVAQGAAIQGGVLRGDLKDLRLLDVTSLSLGIETIGGLFTPLIDRNTTIPTSVTKRFTTAHEMQELITFKVFQGERPMASDNKFLDKFDLPGIAAQPRGKAQVDVTFEIDADGIMHISAMDLATGKSQSVTVAVMGRDRMRSEEGWDEEGESYSRGEETSTTERNYGAEDAGSRTASESATDTESSTGSESSSSGETGSAETYSGFTSATEMDDHVKEAQKSYKTDEERRKLQDLGVRLEMACSRAVSTVDELAVRGRIDKPRIKAVMKVVVEIRGVLEERKADNKGDESELKNKEGTSEAKKSQNFFKKVGQMFSGKKDAGVNEADESHASPKSDSTSSTESESESSSSTQSESTSSRSSSASTSSSSDYFQFSPADEKQLQSLELDLMAALLDAQDWALTKGLKGEADSEEQMQKLREESERRQKKKLESQKELNILRGGQQEESGENKGNAHRRGEKVKEGKGSGKRGG